MKALDDPKRAVRQEAVRGRQAWSLVSVCVLLSLHIFVACLKIYSFSTDFTHFLSNRASIASRSVHF